MMTGVRISQRGGEVGISRVERSIRALELEASWRKECFFEVNVIRSLPKVYQKVADFHHHARIVFNNFLSLP